MKCAMSGVGQPMRYLQSFLSVRLVTSIVPGVVGLEPVRCVSKSALWRCQSYGRSSNGLILPSKAINKNLCKALAKKGYTLAFLGRKKA